MAPTLTSTTPKTATGEHLDPHFVHEYSAKTPPWGFQDLGYIVYKRTYARPIIEDGRQVRTEEWFETLERVINGAQDIGAELSAEEAERLYDYMFNLKGTVAGRMLWQMGTDNMDRFKSASLTNCWFTKLEEPEDFAWLFDMLMLGGGVGYSVRNPQRLGVVREATVVNLDEPDADFIVPDKREGWTDLLLRTLRAYLPGDNEGLFPSEFTYSTQLVRPAGALIKTFGGKASGPGILIDGIRQISEILDSKVGSYLTSVDLLDIANIIGSIVVSGNVRRSAQIALGLGSDTEYLMAKRWDLGSVPNHRAMSNNSIYLGPESIDILPELFWEGYKGNGEPYGLFNLEASKKFGRMGERRFDSSVEGTNPCGEISLAHRESCNLSEIFLPNIDSAAELADVAKLLYKVQKAVASLGYNDPQSNEVSSKNMRLGLGITGVAQAGHRLNWLDPAYRELRAFDEEWSAQRGWSPSIRLTTVKPSGTLSLLAGVTPGVHPGFSRFHIRRVRMAKNDSLVQYCKDRGYHVEAQRNFDKTESADTVVVEFPSEFPEGTIVADDMTAIEQLDLQRRIQRDWADNAVSVTVYIQPGELPEIQQYLRENWKEMKSVSFLLKNDHGFDQAPLEEITEERYRELVSQVHNSDTEMIDLSAEMIDDLIACDGGACPVR